MGDCDGATQLERQRSFLVTAFDLVTMGSLRDLQPLFVARDVFSFLFTQFDVAPRAIAAEVPGVCPGGFSGQSVLTIDDLLTTFLHRVTFPARFIRHAVTIVLQHHQATRFNS